MIDLDEEFERAYSKPHEGAEFDALSDRDKILVAIGGQVAMMAKAILAKGLEVVFIVSARPRISSERRRCAMADGEPHRRVVL